MAHVTLIAEVASNAGRSVTLARAFIQAFAGAGADYLKFQLTCAARLARTDPQRDWFTGAEWTAAQRAEIDTACAAAGVQSLWTVYHPDDVPRVVAPVALKVGSGEAHEGRLADAVLATAARRLFVSEGILPAHRSYLRDPRVVLLGCCTRYPAPRGVVGVRFPSGRYQGWSDHSVGLDESHLAVVLGATVIERHVQLPQQAREPRPWESTVEEFRELRRRVDDDPHRFLGRWSHLNEQPQPL